MEFLRTPGASLLGVERACFDDLKELADRATNEYLLKPDLSVNMNICDAVNNTTEAIVISEFIFYLRRKFGSKIPKVISLSLLLIDQLIKNCSHKVYFAINQDNFVKDFGKLIRKYNAKSGSSNAEVANVSLDLIQSWNAIFARIQDRYPNIPRLYQELRREGIPLNSNIDSSHTPVYSDNSITTTRSGMSSLTNSRNLSSNVNPLTSAVTSSSTSSTVSRNPPSAASNQNSRSSESSAKHSNLLNSIATTSSILKEMISASTSFEDLHDNIVAMEVAGELSMLLASLGKIIEAEVMNNSSDIESLFKLNDDTHAIVSIYEDVRRRKKTLSDDIALLFPVDESSNVHKNEDKKSSSVLSLLDFDVPSTNVPAKVFVSNQVTAVNVSAKEASKDKQIDDLMKHFPSNELKINQMNSRRPSALSNDMVLPANSAKASVEVDPFGPSSLSIDQILLDPNPKNSSTSVAMDFNPFGETPMTSQKHSDQKFPDLDLFTTVSQRNSSGGLDPPKFEVNVSSQSYLPSYPPHGLEPGPSQPKPVFPPQMPGVPSGAPASAFWQVPTVPPNSNVMNSVNQPFAVAFPGQALNSQQQQQQQQQQQTAFPSSPSTNNSTNTNNGNQSSQNNPFDVYF